MIIIGIDPGLKGAVCGIDENGELGFSLIPDFLSVLTPNIKHVFVEKVFGMPGQSSVATLTYGIGFGRIIQHLEFFKIPHTLVHPKTWTKVMHAGTDSKLKAKKRSNQATDRLFPGIKFKNDGEIDAALIAEYGRRTLGTL